MSLFPPPPPHRIFPPLPYLSPFPLPWGANWYLGLDTREREREGEGDYTACSGIHTQHFSTSRFCIYYKHQFDCCYILLTHPSVSALKKRLVRGSRCNYYERPGTSLAFLLLIRITTVTLMLFKTDFFLPVGLKNVC